MLSPFAVNLAYGWDYKRLEANNHECGCLIESGLKEIKDSAE